MNQYLKNHVSTSLTVLMIAGLFISQIAPIKVTAAPDPSDVPAFATAWGSNGSADGQFNSPLGLSVDSEDNVYVADTYNDRIQKFDSNGNFITKWGEEGSGDGQLVSPGGVAVDTSGNVYVADTENNRIQKFDSDGTYITKWGSSGSGNGQFFLPGGVAVDTSGNVYVADTENNRIQKFDSNGNFITKWGSSGEGDGQFTYPYGIAVDSQNKVYLVDNDNSRIQKFDSDGNFLAKWGSSGSGNGEFYYLYGVAVDAQNNVYAAAVGNDRIQKFDSNGNYLGQWGASGSGNNQFNGPFGVAAHPNGNIYVVDTNNNRVQKFSYPPETATIVSSESGTDIELSATAFTTFSCSTSVTEDALTTTDPNQDYPLGLVDFCLDVPTGSTQTITITFETDLSASEVTARKYNPTTQTYTDIPDAEITAITLDGNPALQLTYDITDGGDLDDDGLANGTILDPVGLAVDAIEIAADTDDAETLAETGQNLAPISLIAIALMLLSLISFKKGRQTL